MKLDKYLMASVLAGTTVGGWIGNGVGIAHVVAFNGKDHQKAYEDVTKMNIFTRDYAPIVAYYGAGNVLGGLGGAGLVYYRRRKSQNAKPADLL